MMRILLNGSEYETAEASSVARLLDEQGLSRQPCAVEVNRQLVPRSAHEAHHLQEGDEVEIVTLVGGG